MRIHLARFPSRRACPRSVRIARIAVASLVLLGTTSAQNSAQTSAQDAPNPKPPAVRQPREIQEFERGRALFVASGCVHCHAEVRPGPLTQQSPMGPDLRGAGTRLSPAWIERWVRDPQALHPKTTMPTLADADDARDLATWLGDLGGGLGGAPVKTDNPWHDGNGETLFAQRGCIACHVVTPATGDETRRSLHDLAQKTTPRALADRVQHPLTLAPRGSMPDLLLSRADAEQLAGFLCSATKHAEFTAGDAKRGRTRFEALRCGKCHTAPDDVKPAPAPDLVAITGKTGGCLGDAPPAEVPRFRFTATERTALRVFLREPARTEQRDDEVARRTQALGCVRCHGFATGGGMPPAILQEIRDAIAADTTEGSDPPDLTRATERLRIGYVRDVLEKGVRARQYLALRMPVFPGQLVAGLAELVCKPDVTELRPTTVAVAESGRMLTGTGGMSCITCHDFAGQPALGQRGPDLTQMHSRLHPEFLKRWIADPAAIRPGTRMPTFFHAGRSAITTVLGGDAGAQIDALLAYLALGPRMAAPEGLKPPGDTVIVPAQRPIVLRTEFPETSVRTLGIGFPGGLSVAFETGRPALAYVWEGGFIDMRRKWSGRGDGPSDLVGGKVFVGGTRPLWSAGAATFSGYEILGDSVVIVFGRGTPEEIRLALAPKLATHGKGLALALTTARREPFQMWIGKADREVPSIETNATSGLRIGVLAAPRDCAVCVTSSDLVVEGDGIALAVREGGRAQATLWFVSAASDAVRRELSAER